MASTDLAELFGNLTIEQSDEALPAPGRGARQSLPNPFADPIKASIDSGSPYTIYVPADAVSRAVFLINAAARKENVGVRVVVDVERDGNGAVVKGEDGKVQPIVQTKGENKGKVRVRFQGKAERKKSSERPYSLINDPDDKSRKAIRERATGQLVARGSHDEMKAALTALKAKAKASQ